MELELWEELKDVWESAKEYLPGIECDVILNSWTRMRSLEKVREAAKKAVEDHAISLANDPDEQGRVQIIEQYWEPVLEALAELEKLEGRGGNEQTS